MSATTGKQPARRVGGVLRVGVAVLGCTVAFLALVEGASRIAEYWVRPIVADYGLGFTKDSRVFVPDPKDPEFLVTNPSKRLSFHEQRFRVHKEADVRRVFVVGGSCVLLLQDENGMPFYRRIEKSLNVQMEKATFRGFPGPGLSVLRGMLDKRFGGVCRFEIINCGAGAYGSHRLVPVVAEILNYQPDLILYYEAHNEFEEVEQMKYVPFRTLWLQGALDHFATYRLIRNYVTTLRSRQLVKPENRQLLGAATFPYFVNEQPCHPGFDSAMLAARMDALENNIEMIVALCRRHNVPIILSTVPSNLMKPHAICEDDAAKYQPVYGLYQEGKYDEARALAEKVLAGVFHHQATEAENTVLRRVAARNGVPLADVKAAIIEAEPHHFPGETLFWDDCHLYPAGNKILLATFYNTIVKRIDFSTAPARLLPPG